MSIFKKLNSDIKLISLKDGEYPISGSYLPWYLRILNYISNVADFVDENRKKGTSYPLILLKLLKPALIVAGGVIFGIAVFILMAKLIIR